MSSPSDSASKASKRKGNRSVSNLTPNQLERKRANDREAQRAIRARTKETIERLTQENKTLITEKQVLESEIQRLKQNYGPSPPASQYAGSVALGHGSQMGGPGYSMSQFPAMPSYDYLPPEQPFPANLLHGPESSNVSSPSSSGNGDDAPSYMHTGASPQLLEPSSLPATSAVGAQYVKGEMFDAALSDPGFTQPRQLAMPVLGSSTSSSYLSHQAGEDWPPTFAPHVGYHQSRQPVQQGHRRY